MDLATTFSAQMKDDNKSTTFSGDLPLPCQLRPASSPWESHEKVLKISFILFVSVMTFCFVGLNAVPHVAVFTYMIWAAARMMGTAFGHLTNLEEDNEKRGGENWPFLEFLKCPFKAYSFFLLACFVTYNVMGGNITQTTPRNRIAYFSCCIEGLGLVTLLKKIAIRGHVRGLSGMSMIMFALTYTMREVEAFCIAHVHWHNLNDIFLEVLQISSMFLSFMVVWAIFKTYRSSYEQDMDVLKVKYLIPGCLALALVLHPEFRRGSMYSTSWAASFYIDVLALLPQVVMMQRGDGIVEAPIAHFVAATFVSRCFDLFFWWDRWNRGDFTKYMLDADVSGVIIAFFHLICFVLVGDFMYYYFKWRISGAQTSDHIDIFDEISLESN